MQETKACRICGVEYPATLEYFHAAKKNRDGLHGWCKECKKKDHIKNRDRRIKMMRENYRKNNPIEEIPEGYKRCSVCEKIKPLDEEHFNKASRIKDGFKGQCKECRRQEYLNNKEHYLKRNKQRYEENKEEISKKNKIYKEKHREWYRQKDREYYLKNKEEIKERSKQYLYNRTENDIGFKIYQRCRARLYQAVKGYVKSARTLELIGCSVEYLLEHLENQFTEGMTWENYGEWHIDHIIPCSYFDFRKEEHQRWCFNYKNLQPLWAEDNYAKSNKIDDNIKALL